jgi:hypothetical protein
MAELNPEIELIIAVLIFCIKWLFYASIADGVLKRAIDHYFKKLNIKKP